MVNPTMIIEVSFAVYGIFLFPVVASKIGQQN
jgi:hypothetical protein